MRFDAPSDTALDLTNAELASHLHFAPAVEMTGTLRLAGATIHGTLVLNGASLGAPDGRFCLAAQSAIIDGDVELRGLSAAGGKVNFRAATIGGIFDARDATLHHPGAYALSLHQAHVRGSVRLVGSFRSTGAVNLNRVTIDGRLDCTGATMVCEYPTPENPRGTALQAYSAIVHGGMHLLIPTGRSN